MIIESLWLNKLKNDWKAIHNDMEREEQRVQAVADQVKERFESDSQLGLKEIPKKEGCGWPS